MGDKRSFDKAYNLKTGEETLDHYQEWSDHYDKEVSEELGYAQPSRCAEALKAVTDSRNISILDVGCGTGLSGEAVKKAGFETIDGCDFSQPMLDQAKTKGVYENLFKVDLNHPPMPVADNHYDAATAVGVFSFGHVLPDALDEILRVIKPAGHLIIGLNDHYYDEGALPKKLEQLETAGAITILSQEHGEHLPVKGVMGWVIAIQKC